MADKKGNVSSSRKHTLKSCMLAVAKDLLEAEALEKVKERERYMDENCPLLEIPHSKDDLVDLCTKIYDKINVIDEERYNLEYKAVMVCNEI
uniref:Troponin I, fast skeletal muscle n=1 Tax=Salmo salar TaxID=8030 RepID=B9EN78_SALSA|nr:Troponin I, fast skeletal muscle [Salmo salar]